MDAWIVDSTQVSGGTAADQKGVPAPAPELEVVQVADQRLDSDLASVQQQFLPGLHSFFAVPAVDFGPSLVDHQAHRAVGIDLYPVESFLADPHRGQIHVQIDRTGIIHPEDQVALVNLQKGLFPGQLGEKDIGFSGDPDEVALSQLHLDPRIGVSDDPVAADQRKIERHLAPVHVPGRFVGGAAVHEADPCRMVPTGRYPGGGKSHGQEQERGQGSQPVPSPRSRVFGTACRDGCWFVHDGLTSFRRSASLLGSIDLYSILAASIILNCLKRIRATKQVARVYPS